MTPASATNMSAGVWDHPLECGPPTSTCHSANTGSENNFWEAAPPSTEGFRGQT